MTTTPIRGREHSPLELSDFPEVNEYFEKLSLNPKDIEILGLHHRKGGICPGNFIGMVWIGDNKNRTVLQVDSKFSEMDYIKMYAECAAHATIGENMGNCLRFWPEQELINVPDSSDFLLLSAVAYIRELNELCCRHLRRHFLRERQNFVGKVRGKILIGENLRQNIIRQRPDRIFCEYQSISDDILENRILRAALERAARYVAEHKASKTDLNPLQQRIHACRAHLQGISVTRIKRTDFSGARRRGSFIHYQRPLALAKIVLLQLGFDPHQQIQQSQTPPFALDSATLFERYAELKLRQLKYFTNLTAPRSNISGEDHGFTVRVRPDFYVKREDKQHPWILDAKYKKFSLKYSEKDIRKSKGDIYQVAAYSQHRRTRDVMQCKEDEKIKLALIYPSMDQSDELFFQEYKTDAYVGDFHIYKISCPIKTKED